MRLTEIWRSKRRPTVSFEFFPARTAKAVASQERAIDELAALSPDFVSVTFGAGGSTREGSCELIQKIKARGLETLAYFAGYGLGPQTVREVMDRYVELGVENVLAIRGDAPEEASPGAEPDGFPHASDLLAFLSDHYRFCLGAAGYPEGHREAESREKDLEYLELKVERGAEFIITQYCYDQPRFLEFLGRYRALGLRAPLVAGVMPIFSVKTMENLAGLCGATITQELRARIGALPPDDAEALTFCGIELATEQCRQLISAGVAGLHFYTLNKSRSALEIVRRLRAENLV